MRQTDPDAEISSARSRLSRDAEWSAGLPAFSLDKKNSDEARNHGATMHAAGYG
jgi:hypothetical protein